MILRIFYPLLAALGMTAAAGYWDGPRPVQQAALAAAAVSILTALLMIWRARRTQRSRDAENAAARERLLAALPCGLFLDPTGEKILAPVTGKTQAFFRNRDLEGTNLSSVLRGLLADQELAALTRQIQLVTKSGTATRLETSLNFDTGGSFQIAHVELDVRKLVQDQASDLHVEIHDITTGAERARELQALGQDAESQLELLVGILHLKPAQLHGFLLIANGAMEKVNAILKKPARDEDAFRAKLDAILQEVACVRPGALDLGLAAVATRARAFEESLRQLQDKEALGGNDFLPLAVKLDDLFAYLAKVNSAAARVVDFRDANAATMIVEHALRPEPLATPTGTPIISRPDFAQPLANRAPSIAPRRSAPAGSLEGALQSLTEHASQAHHRNVVLNCRGLEKVPTAYQAAVKNIAIQFIRNAIAHGIESETDRKQAGKSDYGTLDLEFRTGGKGGYELLFEDDGRGLNAARIRDIAIAKGIVTAEQAAGMTDRQSIKLIFKTGFTTSTDPTVESGRGIGMSVVRRYVAETGGRVALASVPGRHTRFRVSLPEAGLGKLSAAVVA